MFALTRFKGLINDDIIAIQALSKRIKVNIEKMDEVDTVLVSAKLMKRVATDVDFSASTVLGHIDSRMGMEEVKLAKAKDDRDIRIKQFDDEQNLKLLKQEMAAKL